MKSIIFKIVTEWIDIPKEIDFNIKEEYNNALNPLVSKISCIAIKDIDLKINLHFTDKEEKNIINTFYRYLDKICESNTVQILTWNGLNFDIPFLYQRSLNNDIPLSMHLPYFETVKTYNANKFSPLIIKDIAKIWNCNKYGCIQALIPVAYNLGLIDEKDKNIINKFQKKQFCNYGISSVTFLQENYSELIDIKLKYIEQISKKLNII